MNILIVKNCLTADKLLLCLFILVFTSCNVLNGGDRVPMKMVNQHLVVGVKEKDYMLFMQQMQELNLIQMYFDKEEIENQNETSRLFLISFRFISLNEYLRCRSEILSTGLVKQIN